MALDVHRTRAPTFSNERGPGTFVSLGSLPKRKSHPPPHNRKSPVFHIHGDEDGDDNSLSSSDDQTHTHPDTQAKNSPQLPASVPFPRRSPSPPSDILTSSPSITSSRSLLSRRSPSTILLSNGKPLKSSLKSSTSSLSIQNSPQFEPERSNNHLHLRSRSEPSTPTAQIPKNVHFPETDGGLASIRIFSRSARPAAVSTPDADETETEGEDQSSTGFPFPKFPSPSRFEIDSATSSVVPVTHIPHHTNILLESLVFSYPSATAVNPHLTGTVLLRNVAYEKHAAVRFTLDDWQTVSEVAARYVVSLPSLPSVFSSPSPRQATLGDIAAQGTNNIGWDRFSFIIRLEDYGHNLGSRVIWLAARYRVGSTYPTLSTQGPGPGGEWWDNNNAANYRVAFRPVSSLPSPSPPSRTRRETAPEPIIPSMVAPPPPMSHEHGRDLFVSPFISPSSKTTSSSSSPTKNGKEKISLPLTSGKLHLPNYAAPPVRPTTPSSSVPAQCPPSPSSPFKRPTLQVDVSQPHDYEPPSPASSTLSTPSVSPNMVPRVLINGHPANYACPPYTQAHIDNWDWMAPPVQSTFLKQPSTRRSTSDSGLPRPGHGTSGLPSAAGGQPSNGMSGFPPGSEGLSGDSLYNAFVTRWCFAQGPTVHGPLTGDDGGILA